MSILRQLPFRPHLARRLFDRMRVARSPVRITPLPDDVVVERDVPIRVRDGAILYANVYRPAEGAPTPVILSCSPYGKDDCRGRRAGYDQFRIGIVLFGLEFGDIEVSEGTSFEAPDPAFWVPEGYTVVHYDTRGAHHSEGELDLFSRKDREDFYDAIEWAGTQPWSNGRVGLCGVSYLAISQWFVAAAQPPHLKAIIPWEGLSDVYRDCAHHGGIPETGFPAYYIYTLFRVRNRAYGMARNFFALATSDALMDDFWAERVAALEDIEVPALVCASWSDQGLHTRGAFEAFERMASPEKFLFAHGRKKWETFYSPEALAAQWQFFERYLKGRSDEVAPPPRTRLEVRVRDETYRLRHADDFPVPGTNYRTFYLDAGQSRLTEQAPSRMTTVGYRARSGRAAFSYRFAEDTEIVGHMALRLWVSCTRGGDMDLFAGVRKIDPDGNPVDFPGLAGNQRDMVAKGWLRVSHRQLDPVRTEPHRPFHTHRRRDRLRPGELACVDIEILPSATLFERGSRLSLVIQGRDLVFHPVDNHKLTRNRGRHLVHTGGEYDSYLLVPDATDAFATPTTGTTPSA
jgi:predicted acyl esterase